MKTLLNIYQTLTREYKELATREKTNKFLKSYYWGKADAFADVVETIKIFLGSEDKNE